MKPETKEKIKLTVREILLSFCDGIATFEEIVGYEWQRREIQKYWDWRDLDKERFYHSLWQLEKQGYIKRYKGGKKNLIKLTKIGQEKAMRYVIKDWQIEKPKIWDKKWRIVIFDIPNDKKILREIVRQRLKYWGFHQLQESVFVYPFDCNKEVSALKYAYNLGKYVQYLVAESIETELDLVDLFYQQRILPTTLV